MQAPNATAFALLFSAWLALAAPAQASPLGADGGRIVGPATRGENPQEREHRAGIQAQIKGDIGAAKSHFEAALRIDAKFAPALVGLAGVAQAQQQPLQVEQFLARAEQAAPKAPEVHLAWGRHFLSSRQFPRAEAAFIKARELAPRTMPPLLELGEVYLRMPGRQADALRMFRDAVAIDAKSPFAQYGLGIAAAAAGQRAQAFGALEQAAQLAPKDPAPPRAIGRLHLETGDLDKALAAFDAGLARHSTFVPLMLDRSDALARLARWDDATQQLDAAAKLAPRQAEIALKLGDVHQGVGRWASAETQYLRAIELAPNNPLAYNNLAWMTVARKGDVKKAREWALKAVSLSPGSSPLHDTLGWAARADGNLAAAQTSLQRAIEIEPRVAAYHVHLGTVQAELGQATAARASLHRAIEIEPKGAQSDEARRLLKTLPGGG